MLEQTNAGGQRWIYTHFTERVTVRALMVKTLNVNNRLRRQRVPDPAGADELPGRDRLLLNTPLPH